MGSSPGFASAPTDYTPCGARPIQTRFRFGFGAERLNLANEEQLVGSLCKRHAVTPRRGSDWL